jgi:zinc D-Ala-D-Ala dipeptidase
MAQVWSRRSIAERLTTVNQQLATVGVELFVLNGYRPLSLQKELWDFFIEKARCDLTNPSEAECVAFAGRYCSDPRDFDARDSRTWPTHTTGGALDTTLREQESGDTLYMGGIFDDPDDVSHTAHYEEVLAAADGKLDRLSLSDVEALRNRRLLYWTMYEAGFANYAYEWWHFDWGTQLWAIDSKSRDNLGKKVTHAWYGPVDSPS